MGIVEVAPKTIVRDNREAAATAAVEKAAVWRVLLIAITTAVTLQTFRVVFPEGYGLADRQGNETAAALMGVVFAAPFLVPVLRRFAPAQAMSATLFALAAWRVAVLVPSDVPLALAVAGTVVALLALTLVLTAPGGPGAITAAAALVFGVACDAAVRGAFATWDPVWQRSPAAFVVGGLVAAALVVATVRSARVCAGPAAISSGRAGVAVGAVLALEVLFLASPAFVASSAGISLSWSVFVVLAGSALALVAVFVGCRAPRSASAAVGAALVVVAFLLPRVSGAGAVAAVLVGQVAAGLALAMAVSGAASSRLRAELGLAGGWLVFVAAVMLYQLHFEQPLPFDNRWVLVAAAAVAAVAGLGMTRRSISNDGEPSARWALVGAGAAVMTGAVIAGSLAATAVDAPEAAVPGRALRIVEWNVRQAVRPDGDLAPDTIASVLTRDAPPDVVVLPETARGWPVSGDLDLASWLSRRLDLPFVWSPAADNQFGTVLLSRLPVVAADVIHLPVAGRAQGRSLLRATLDIGDGRPLTVLATHLQHRNDPASIAARGREIERVLQAWDGAPRAIVIGDLNPRQGDPPLPARRPGEFPEIRAFLDAGFTTAQELTGCSQPTSERNCSDFVLVTRDLDQRVDVLMDDDVFGHRPVVSTTSVRD